MELAQASSPAALEARGIRHEFAGASALDDVSLRVPRGQFCTLLGPSGSGKTTLLRIFAGLLSPTAGQVLIDDTDVTDTPVQERGIGFVFQSYALFPHLSVAQNIEYPLRLRRVDKARRRRQVADMLKLIGLEGYGDRRPGELSGGQQQRVAVGRALVFEPEVLLLDEPLGALDRRLRQQLGVQLRRIQKETGTTAIYVTHDQEEAFLLSDVVVVMNEGRVRQAGTQAELYANPADLFVAGFLGDTNLLHGKVKGQARDLVTLEVCGTSVDCRSLSTFSAGAEAACSIRPEDVYALPVGSDGPRPDDWVPFGSGTVEESMFLGSRARLSLQVRGKRLLAETKSDAGVEVGTAVTVGWRRDAPVLLAHSHG
ncbi:MAG: ABC transporter ATP-binding protein [Actinobacteria bacterium]|nr:ABC transporter ATP-binding protein [Actinomycetota bacterium]